MYKSRHGRCPVCKTKEHYIVIVSMHYVDYECKCCGYTKFFHRSSNTITEKRPNVFIARAKRFLNLKTWPFEDKAPDSVPDLHVCNLDTEVTAWIELKYVRMGEAFLKFQPGQPAWINEYIHTCSILGWLRKIMGWKPSSETSRKRGI